MDDSSGQGIPAISDTKLINGMRDPGCSKKRLRLLRGEFYARYAPGFYVHCKYKYSTILNNEELLVEFVDDVLMDFFQKNILRFDLRVARIEEEIPKLIRNWLAKSAEWKLSSRLKRSQSKEIAVINLDVVGSTSVSKREECHERLTQQQHQIQQMREQLDVIMNQLGEKVRDVVYTSYKFYDLDKDIFLIPIEVQERLCRQWKFPNRNALVKFRSRSIMKIKAKMTELIEVA